MSRILPATAGRRDGEEVTVAASAGEVQGEGEILSNYSTSVVGGLSFSRFLKLFVCLSNI